MEPVERAVGVVCDLDGVVYRGDEPIPGAAEALERMRASGMKLLFCTTNSYPTVEDYERKLADVGIDMRREELVTSAIVTAEVLAARGMAGAEAIVIGGDGLRESLRGVGVEPSDTGQASRADLVVVGYDPTFDYDAMRRGSLALRAGALFVATNDDASFPAPGGALWPGAGAILASLVTASGRLPEVMGKPHAPMMDALEARLAGTRRILIVGDRPDTDLAGGRVKGWTTVLVLSGVTGRAEVAGLDHPPDMVVDDIGELAPPTGTGVLL